MKTETTEDQLTLKQEARGKLRESFLKAVNSLHGERCSILTYEQSKLTGTFSSWKPDGSEMLIHDLKTPANIVMTSALLRTPDVLVIQFDKPVVILLTGKTIHCHKELFFLIGLTDIINKEMGLQ